jgi:hypothetical protein
MSKRMIWVPFFVSLLMFITATSRANTWRGTAPFCAGECLPGEQKMGESDYGDGGYCVTGKKVLCGNANPSCPTTSTKAECYGVVKICENGSADQTGFWRGCNTYACGLCVGIGSTSSALTFGAPPCKQGFVWREAVKDDYVCVPPATRSQAAQDNARAAQRRSPTGGTYGPATCLPGFVWREAAPSDLVCVTPAIRAQVVQDNRLAAERRVSAPVDYGPDTCKQGYVWREAIPNDRVCVTPQTRAQAKSDNAAAASRRSSTGGPSGPDTCKPGYVWREVVPTDHVCVTPSVRQAAANDNRAAKQRRVAH